MPTRIDLALGFDGADDPAAQRRAAADALGVPLERVAAVRVRRRSIDARRRGIRVHVRADVYLDEPPRPEPAPRPDYRGVSGSRSAVIVGAGPAGLFAALRLIELGVRPVVVERGKDVQARRRDLAAIHREGVVDSDSNYCFGEGGAGTYSDGKLYTRSTKRGDVEGVLRTLVAHGAPADILVDAHPHVGSNRLPKVITALRRSIEAAGGELRLNRRVVDLLFDARRRVRGVVCADGSEVTGEGVLLAPGHSARDVFELLDLRAVGLLPKQFAVGVRLEHPQGLVDRIQYHGVVDARLPAASYRLATTVDGRGVFSFCMCPGGFIVPAATVGDEVVVNGMSLSRRDSPFANSGIVAAVEVDDLAPWESRGSLAGVAYQRALETMAARAGGGAQRAPAQRLTDFLAGRDSSSLPPCSYRPGLAAAPLHELLPPPLANRLQAALRIFGSRMHGYVTEEAVVVGVETRTSSPVRVPRAAESLSHPDVPGLYPCGEGAGYAGGIVSAALDGIRVAEAVAARAR